MLFRSTLSVDDALQAQVQATPAAIAAIFSASGRQFDLQTKRKIADGSVEFVVNDSLTLNTRLRRTNRDGTIPGLKRRVADRLRERGAASYGTELRAPLGTAGRRTALRPGA